MADKQDDLKKVKELIDLMKENDLVEIELSDGDRKIHLKRPQAIISQIPMPPAPPVYSAPAPSTAFSKPLAEMAFPEESGLVEIKSPIVGTFYAAPNPEANPYVQTGERVAPDTIVCIVEAMKVMNEIKAETSGTIVEILVKDGQSVEFGQVLFKVRP